MDKIPFETSSDPRQSLLSLSINIPTIERKINDQIFWKPAEISYFTEDLGASLAIPLQMIKIPSGSFLMGGAGNRDDENPPHQVNLQSFFMGRYPVTQEQWKAIAERKELKIALDLNPDPSYFKDDYEEISRWKRPVETVSWPEAMEYCARLSKLTGRHYNLPSESQWEYACRAGTATSYYFGNTISTDLANYQGKTRRGVKESDRKQTTPVDYFNAPNPFGLSDMHGNVYEWCLDPWHKNYNGAPNDGRVWDQGLEDLYDNVLDNPDLLLEWGREHNVLRGGSWSFGLQSSRSGSRANTVRSVTHVMIGFRVVCAVGISP